MSDVTRILSQLETGDPSAAEELLPMVYEELRKLAAAKLAHEKPGQTLQATALVHEAYMRLVGNGEQLVGWSGRRQFFAAAAEAMRRILVNRARDKSRLKRGGGRAKLNLDQIEVAWETPPDMLILLDEAIDKLAGEDEVCFQLVKLRFFSGLSHSEAASLLGLSRSAADRHWAYARAWLYQELRAK